ncbi:MAG: hypothetical protein CSA65_09825 [Proteobacteria bacterium]|nr:MAG: hypothetical protein CSA65_09825 [Pseudomonadota bacterium]
MRNAVIIGATLAPLLAACDCRCAEHDHERGACAEATFKRGDARIVPRRNLVALAPLPREPGPPRPETVAEIAAARQRARGFVATLKGSLNRREVTALADIRGYGFYRQRQFGQAHEWFLAAVATDPSFELSLYNAARTAALLGRFEEAKRLIERLRALDTPLARMRLKLGSRDPDLAVLRGGPKSKSKLP